MASPSPTIPKVKLAIPVVVIMGVLAFFAFLVSVFSESRYEGGPLLEEELVEYVAGSGVEHRESGAESWQSLNSSVTLSSGMSFRTDSGSELGIYFGSADLLRLFPDTEVEMTLVDLTSSPIQVNATLVSGSVWLSDLQGVADLKVQTAAVEVDPIDASTEVAYQEGVVNVFAARHPVRITFLDVSDGKRPLNDYLLTESHQVEIRESRLTKSLEQLRYTKLTKEYPFVYVDADEWSEEWEAALEADNDRQIDTFSAFFSGLRREGHGGYEEGSVRARWEGFTDVLRSWLTVSDRHLMEIEEDEGLDLFYQALYLMDQGESSEALDRLSRFESAVAEFTSLEKLETVLQVFRGVLYGSEFYTAKESLRSVRLASLSDENEQFELSLKFLRDRLNEVYDLLDQGGLNDAKEALIAYNEAWKVLISSISTQALSEQVQRLTEERQILQNLLYREDSFYSVKSYEVLSELEERILNLTAEEYDLNEERLAFIQDKIRVLNRLVDLIDHDLVGVKAGSDLGYQLLADAQEMMDDVTSQAAVTGYFVSALVELDLKFDFINSKEYQLGEGTFEDRFEDYLKQQGELEELEDYISGLTTTSGESITYEEALVEVQGAFEEANITTTTIVGLGDSEYRLFSIQGGQVASTDFVANYDRESGIVFDLVVEGKAYSTGVRLENLYDFIQQIEAQPVTTAEESEGTSETSPGETLTAVEEFAIDRVRTIIDESTELILTSTAISILDIDQNLFQVHATMKSGFVLDFTFDSEPSISYDIIADSNGTLFVVEGDVPIDDIEDSVNETWKVVQSQ